MSYYDTENMMQTLGNGFLQQALIKAKLIAEFIDEAIKVLYELEPKHCKSAYYHCKVKGDNTPRERMDKFLGIDDIMKYETLTGEIVYIAIDWTDDPLKVSGKAKRMGERKAAYDELNISYCLAVCVDDQVLLRGTRQEQMFINEAYGIIFEEIDAMVDKGAYNRDLLRNQSTVFTAPNALCLATGSTTKNISQKGKHLQQYLKP